MTTGLCATSPSAVRVDGGISDAGSPVTVAVVQEIFDPTALEDHRIGHHPGVPTALRGHQPRACVVALPSEGICGLGVTQAIAVASGREPHAVAISVADHAWAADGVLVTVGEVDRHSTVPPPVDAV